MSAPIRLMIVDDHYLFRQGVLHTLQDEPDFLVVGEAASLAEAVQMVQEAHPDVILLDVILPDGSGLDALPAFRELAPDARVLVLTVSDEDQVVVRAIVQGAQGYLLKGVAASELVAAVRAVHAGNPCVTPSLALGLVRHLAEREGSGGAGRDELTLRERQILEGIGAGKTNREIAEDLHISEKTVKHHVTNVLRKLHLRNRVEVALAASKHPSERAGTTGQP
jgi:DNA-binding NarL/FixJ family response regulator